MHIIISQIGSVSNTPVSNVDQCAVYAVGKQYESECGARGEKSGQKLGKCDAGYIIRCFQKQRRTLAK